MAALPPPAPVWRWGGDALARLSAPPAPFLSSETKPHFHPAGSQATFVPGPVSGAAAGRGPSAGGGCPGLGAQTGVGGWGAARRRVRPQGCGGRGAPSRAGGS